jgi:rod shape-determining protein MreC
MRNLLNFFIRFNNLIIFLILEGIAFYLIATGNNYHNTRVVNIVRGLTYGMEERIDNARTYLNLRDINEKLAAENIAAKNTIEGLIKKEQSPFLTVSDSVYKQQYIHTSAEVIENSVNRQKNFFTINKGKRQGITVDMAVISDNGAAGIIVGCSDNYSVAMSLLNLDFRLSVRIRSNGYFGSLTWNGRDYNHAILNEIPQHIAVQVGDTLETTGYSAIFPEGILVGTINDFERKGGDFYRINVKLMTDFKKIHFVDVIGNLKRNEQLELEKQFR